jgi:hypothetical protein
MRFVVMTTINEPQESVKVISKLSDLQLIVVGDLKTPESWAFEGVEFLDIKKQERLGFESYRIIPMNHYSRKNLGYLQAMRENATEIIDIDDDNVPYNFAFPSNIGFFDQTEENLDFINIYNLFTKKKIWPRGLPLRLISKDYSNLKLTKSLSRVGIWQGLANNEPDVDAIYRLTINERCDFDNREPVVLGLGTLSPFNSQNTLFIKELFPLLYLPISVTFRFTDILRSLVALPVMKVYGWQLGFRDANVIQYRNDHDLLSDFISEIPMYEREDIVKLVSSVVDSKESIYSNLLNAYKELLKYKIVKEIEIEALKIWISDVRTILENK